MNYQGEGSRKDLVWIGLILWFMISYYPFLTLALIASLLISIYWERASSGASVVVNLFRARIYGKKSGGGGGGKGGGHLENNLNLTKTVIQGEANNMKETV